MSIESVSRKDFLRGRFDPLDDPNFVIIEQKYADKDSMLMQSEAYEAFLKWLLLEKMMDILFVFSLQPGILPIRNIFGRINGTASFL